MGPDNYAPVLGSKPRVVPAPPPPKQQPQAPVVSGEDYVCLVHGPDWVPSKHGKLAYAPRVEVRYNDELIADDFDTFWEAQQYCEENFGSDGYFYVDLR